MEPYNPHHLRKCWRVKMNTRWNPFGATVVSVLANISSMSTLSSGKATQLNTILGRGGESDKCSHRSKEILGTGQQTGYRAEAPSRPIDLRRGTQQWFEPSVRCITERLGRGPTFAWPQNVLWLVVKYVLSPISDISLE
jgi:hypothetical protein